MDGKFNRFSKSLNASTLFSLKYFVLMPFSRLNETLATNPRPSMDMAQTDGRRVYHPNLSDPVHRPAGE